MSDDIGMPPPPEVNMDEMKGHMNDMLKAFKAEQERQIEMYRAQMKAQKEVIRVSDLRSAVAQHSHPQMKRSVGFLKKLMHRMEDSRDLIYKFLDKGAVSTDNVEEATSVLNELGDLLHSVEELLEHEMAMNCIASREKLGWLVVKMLEKDPLFVDDDDGYNIKDVRAAAQRAAEIAKDRRSQYPCNRGTVRRGKGGRARSSRRRAENFGTPATHFSGSGRAENFGSQATHFSGSVPIDAGFGFSYSSPIPDAVPSVSCFRCGLPGYFQKFCRGTHAGQERSKSSGFGV